MYLFFSAGHYIYAVFLLRPCVPEFQVGDGVQIQRFWRISSNNNLTSPKDIRKFARVEGIYLGERYKLKWITDTESDIAQELNRGKEVVVDTNSIQ